MATTNINIPTQVSQTITDGVTNKAPSEDVVHDALEQKLDITALPSNLTLYPTSVASDIVGYFKMVTTVEDPDFDNPAVDFVTPTITTVNQLVGSVASTAGILTGNPGILPNVTTIGNIKRNSGTGTANFYFEVYHRTSAGVETLIGTSGNTLTVSSSVYEEFFASVVWDNGNFLTTDRIVIKYYANRIAGGSNPVYSFQFGGATPTRTTVPVPASVLLDVPIQIGVTEVVDGTSGRVLTVDNGVVGEKAIDTTPMNGSTNLIDSNAVFDGLALKQDKLYINKVTTNSATVTGTTADTELYKITIPANSLSSNDILYIDNVIINKIGTAGTAGIRIKLSTSATFPAGIGDLIGTAQMTATQLTIFMGRFFLIQGGFIRGFSFTNTTTSPYLATGTTLESKTFDPTVVNYLYISVFLASAADSVTGSTLTLRNF